MTSEEKHGITKQPAESCPLVDEAVKTIKAAELELRGWEAMELPDLKNATDYAVWRFDQLHDELEKIRTANEEIRQWGQEWKDLAKSLDESHSLLSS